MENKKYQFCPRCGQRLNETKNFCPKCGLQFTKENIIERLMPTSEKILDVKQFIMNHFEIMHIAYLLVFLAGLLSAKLGCLCLIGGLLVTYVLSVLDDNQPMLNNTEKGVEAQFDQPEQQVSQPIKTQAAVNLPTMPAEIGPTESTATPQTGLNPAPAVNPQGRFGVIEILLMIASVMSLLGVVIGGFFKNSDASLFRLLTDTSTLVGYVENAESIMTGSSSNNAMSIQLVGYLLIIMPIFVVILGLLKSRLANTLSCLGAILEVIFMIDCITKVVHLYKQVPQFIMRHVPNMFGAPVYILVTGVLIMALMSITIWAKGLLSDGVEISE